MIFTKTLTPQKTSNPKKINILGDSALGLTIANELQNIGHKINIICSPQTADEYNATDFVFKDSRFLQHHRTNFSFSFEQKYSPDLLIIASDIVALRQDLLLLSPTKLQKTMILNLSPCSPQSMLAEILGSTVTEARNHSLHWKNQNTISNSESGITLYLSPNTKDNQISILQEILKNSKIEIEQPESFNLCHWEWIALRTLLMLCLYLKQPIQSLHKDSYCRSQAENCLKEISHIANLNPQTINTSKIINSIQNIPNNHSIIPLYGSKPYNTYAERLFNIIFQEVSLDKKRFPTLKTIFNNT